MQLSVKEMNEELARQILQWEYEAPYDFYNNELTDENLQELLTQPYFAVVDEKEELVGFFCSGVAAQVPSGSRFGVYDQDLFDIGIGMSPDLTGKGLGKAFFPFILSHIQKTYNISSIRLTVATFNSRAIRLYEKLGFVKQHEFQNIEIGFITMVKEFK